MSGQCFVVPGQTILDLVLPSGLGAYSKETLEQIQARHPGAVVMDFDEAIIKHEEAACTPAVEITRESWIEKLEVLPPDRWIRVHGSESFELCEHTTARVTGCFVQIGSRYFTFQGIAGVSHNLKLAVVKAAFPDVEVRS